MGWAEMQVRLLNSALEARVTERTAELRARYEREHNLVLTLQRALLLAPLRAQFPGLTLASFSEPGQPEALVSGDFCDAFRLDGDHVALVLGDICGKGLVAAMHVPAVKFALQAFLSENASPGHALSGLNDWLCDSRDASPAIPLATLTIVTLNRRTGQGVCAVAGAEAPLILGDDEAAGVPTAGLMLGVERGQAYSESAFQLRFGEALLLATDGLTEARRGLSFLGDQGLADLAQYHWKHRSEAESGVRAVGQAILDGARRFAGGPLHDDASLLLVERCTE
jgi:serine phosphatase RsbU (regulator of sigma subunit)